eukprot:SAG11_NODE_141_length_14934_cov_4.821503_8_plen_152_part_00
MVHPTASAFLCRPFDLRPAMLFVLGATLAFLSAAGGGGLVLEHLPGASCAVDVAPDDCPVAPDADEAAVVAHLTLSLDDFITFALDLPSFSPEANATLRYLPLCRAALEEAQELAIIVRHAWILHQRFSVPWLFGFVSACILGPVCRAAMP